MTAALVLAAVVYLCEMYEAGTAADAAITATEGDRVTGEDTRLGLRAMPEGWLGREADRPRTSASAAGRRLQLHPTLGVLTTSQQVRRGAGSRTYRGFTLSERVACS